MTNSLIPINLFDITLSTRELRALSIKFIQKHNCLIFELNEQTKILKIATTSNEAPIALIRSYIGASFSSFSMEFYLARIEDFNLQKRRISIFQEFELLIKDLKAQHKKRQAKLHDEDSKEDSAALCLLDCILRVCIEEGASDIHLELSDSKQHATSLASSTDTQSLPNEAIVRQRIDGMLQERFCFDKEVFEALSSRLKLECELDITQVRQAQDGRFEREFMGRGYDFRISCLPTFGGESIVIRILGKSAEDICLDTLGLPHKHLNIITRALKAPHGMILLTGPTGSGKSTTLYAMLQSIQSPTKKLITLEDPIEYHMKGITQTLINDKHEFGFAKALRALLRQDPDVLMIGEIRDEQTLQIALKASLTGHLVLSTLHANDSISAIERLLDMGAQGYLIGSTISVILSQRLARKLCPHCKESLTPQDMHTLFDNASLLSLWESNVKILESGTFFAPKGCQHCHLQGFSGRVLLTECLPNSPHLSTYAKNPHTKEEFMKTIRDEGFLGMFENALHLLASGISSFDEIYRVCKI